MALCICGVRWSLPLSQDDTVGSQLHFECYFIHVSCRSTSRLGKTWEEAAAKSNLFTSPLPLQGLEYCGQPQDSSTGWKWSGKSVPHPIVQTDVAELDMACSSRCGIHILWAEDTGNREMPGSIIDTVHMAVLSDTHLCTHGSSQVLSVFIWAGKSSSNSLEFLTEYGQSLLCASYCLFIHQISLFQVIFLYFKSAPL